MSEADRCPLGSRARTAIGRTDLSRPLKYAVADGLIHTETRVFDYGCGRGDDIKRLRAMGFDANGWDPVHCPDGEIRRSPVVNLGYVVNVIEDANERREALRKAWAVAETVLIVSARLTLERRALRNSREYADGCLTSRGTFQKFFDHQELRQWIDRSLKENAVPAAPGIFYVFKDDQSRVNFIASCYHRRRTTPRLNDSVGLFREHRKLLEPLMRFLTNRGRLPFDDELRTNSEIVEVFGSLRSAFRVVVAATEDDRWKQIRHVRIEDILVYLALSQFDGRPSFGHLPLSLRRDIREFFGSYRKACQQADELLFSLGRLGVVDAVCRRSGVGKLTPSALYVHESVLAGGAEPLLRLYEGCARGYLGRVEGANIVKLHRGEPMVSYLSYPRFEKDPHPTLAFAITVHLQTFRVRARDYTASRNRPILHRKELFVRRDDCNYRKFARLTRIEESKGLYDDTSRIGYEDGWNEVLELKGLYLRGHRLLVSRGQKAEP